MTYHWTSMRPVDRAAAVIDLRDAGNRKEDIASALGIAVDELVEFCGTAGIPNVTNRVLPRSWFHELSIEDRCEYIRKKVTEGVSPAGIAADAQITVEALRKFAAKHGVRGLSNRMVDVAARHACVPDERMVDPAAWVPLAEPVADLVDVNGCMWPVDGGWCGCEKAKRGSYCETHKAMAYGRKAS